MKRNLSINHFYALITLLWILLGGGYKLMGHDFMAINEGKTIYYTITDTENHYVAVAPNGTSTNSYEGDIVIPEKVINPNNSTEYTVTSIANAAFMRSYTTAIGGRVTSITLPETITLIGNEAFKYGGDYLTSVNIPDNVTQIGDNAFYSCNGITTLIIPENITSIGINAFKGCTGLTNIYFNAKNVTASPTTSSNSAFYSTACTNACTVTIGPDVEYIPTYVLYGLSNVSIINYNATECADFASSDYLNIWPTMASGCILNIGDNVTKIPAYAFRQKSSLSSINMGNSVVTIGDYAFTFSSKSTNITGEIALPETLTTIGEYAFQNCAGITFNWPSNITSIGRNAFYYCEKLATVVINNAITEIPDYTFQGCTGLTTLTIGTGVKTIGNSAFQGCTGLTNITLNATLTTVPSNSSYYAFKSCTCANACTLTIGTEVSSIPTNTFNGLSNVLTIYFNATLCTDFASTNYSMPSVPSSGTFASVFIGDNVTRIPSYMFKGKKLSHITIGSSVESIGDEAFSTTGTITSDLISKPSTPPTLGTNTFQYGNKSNPTYVPSGSVSAYQAATGWSSFTNYKSIYEIAESQIIETEGTLNCGILSLTGEGHLTVNNNGTLNCDYIWGSTPENLILNDSAQLICKNSVAATWNKTITNAGAKDVKDHWYTITSPVHEGTNNYITISNTNTVNLTAANYDMFAYDEAGTWLNQKAGSGAAGFTTMEVGKGYLYRNSGNQLSFVGNTTVGKQTVNLKKTGTSNISGLNLIANPFSHNIYLGNGGAIDNANLADNFYYISDRGTWQIGTYETPIIPGRGIIVQTDSDNMDLDILDKTTSANPPSKASATELQFILNGNQYQDIAYAVLNEGYGLSKLEHPNEAAPMLFINHNDKNYAVAHMNSNTRSFNLGLSAKSFGQYTLKYKAKGNVKYLHVIDRLTGNDVDMLLEGEYSFIASPTDNENRFLVVLESLEALETLDGSFAYQNGNDIIVNGEGNLQIFDVMGRLIATQRVNGVETVNVSMTGVYIFKLNEKTQKIIIR